jgi:hypothetical protein
MTNKEFESLKRCVLVVTTATTPAVKELGRLYERACERDWTPRETKRVKQLEDELSALAAEVECKAYFHRDPRGWPVWLFPAEWDDEFIAAHRDLGIPAGLNA